MVRSSLITSLFLLVMGSSCLWASYSLSLGKFDQDGAESLHRQLVSRGYPVYLLYGESYEVRMGSYDTMEFAEEAAEKLKSEEKVIAVIVEEDDIDQLQFSWKDEGGGKEVNQETVREYSDSRAQKIVSCGLDLFGHPYKYGGTKIGKGIDCSFFVQSIFRELGIHLPRTSGEQFKTGQRIDMQDLKVGDLVFFKKTYYSRKKKHSSRNRGITRINHVGIYIGNGEFIHATLNVMHVTISRLNEAYFMKRFAGACRILSD